MTVTTVRPSSTDRLGDADLIGAGASAHARLAETPANDSNAVGIESLWGDLTTFGFTEPSLPSGAIGTAVIVRARMEGSNHPVLGTLLEAGVDQNGNTVYAATTVNVPSSWQTTALVGAYGDGSTIIVSFWSSASAGIPVLSELYADVYYVEKPTVDITAPTGSPTKTTENLIDVAWTSGYDVHGGANKQSQIKVFDSATVAGGGFAPGSSTPDIEIDLTSDIGGWSGIGPLANDTYRVYVRVANDVGSETQWSDWDYETITINVTPPDPPAIDVTDDPTNGRAAIAITPDNTPVTVDHVVVERSRDDGDTWETVGTKTGSGAGTIYDYLVGAGEIDYRAQSFDSTGNKVSTYATDTITHNPTSWWLKHPTDETYNVAVQVRSQPGITSAANQSIVKALGRSDSVVISDTRGSDQGSITFLTESASELAELLELFKLVVPLYVVAPSYDLWTDRWCAFGDIDASRIVDHGAFDEVDFSVDWTEVEAPS